MAGTKESKTRGRREREPEPAPVPTGPMPKARLAQRYEEHVRPLLAERFGITNPMQAPRLEKIVVNVNMGRHLEGNKIPPHVRSTVIQTLERVTGQRPVIVRAKKSVSNFKVRKGYETAAMVTLRRHRMWSFLDRLINLAAPRIKDFRGLPRRGLDRAGNYSMGLSEQGVFPEINMAEVEFTHGMHINIVFRNSTRELSEFVLEQLGMPFQRTEARPEPRG